MAITARRLAALAGQQLRTVWAIVGITLLMLLFVEGVYRGQRAVRARLPSGTPTGGPSPRDPQTAERWYAEYASEEMATRPQRWKPYVYWGRRPNFQGKHVTLDAAGRRVTPHQPGGSPAARVYFFGGSTMWGIGQRDDHTIPAEASRRLQALATRVGSGRVEVTNFGETGYIETQEVLELIFALRAGGRPDVVVFYDGINDVGTTVQYGEAGVPQNESKRVAEFEMGRALDRPFEHSLGEDLHALRLLAGQALHQIKFAGALRATRPIAEHPYIAADSAARRVVDVYAENAHVIEGLAKEYGFVPIYIWQPSVHSTQKRTTPFEARILNAINGSAFNRRIAEVHRRVPALLEPRMAAIAPGRFVNADSLFRGDSVPVFLDHIGHTNEAAVPRIVDSFWPLLQSAVERRIAPTPRNLLQGRHRP